MSDDDRPASQLVNYDDARPIDPPCFDECEGAHIPWASFGGKTYG